VAFVRALAVACLVTTLGVGVAKADASVRVLLVVDQSDDAFAERVRAELVGLGLHVIVAEPWRTGEQIVALDVATRTAQAAAGIRMLPSRKGVEVWMADQPAGRSLLRQMIVDEHSEPNQGLVALQTAELLRTALLSSPLVRKTEPAPAAPAPAAPTVSPPNEVVVASPAAGAQAARAGVQAALGAMISPGGGDAALQTWLSLYRFVTDRWALALDVSAPVRTASLTGPEGSARLGVYMVGAALVTAYDKRDSGTYASAGAGAGILRIEAAGTANAAFDSQVETAVTGILYARGDAGLVAADWLRFGLRGVVGGTVSKVNVRFAGNEAGSWGRPFLAGLAVAELTWR
jgi:hypothetical protein